MSTHPDLSKWQPTADTVYASPDIEAAERARVSRETQLDGVPGAIDTTGRGDWDAGPVTVRVEDLGASESATVAQVSVYGVQGWPEPQDWGASFELSVAEAQTLIAALQRIVDTHDTGEGINAAQAAYRERLARNDPGRVPGPFVAPAHVRHEYEYTEDGPCGWLAEASAEPCGLHVDHPVHDWEAA
jgi:hypothetical protein